MRPNIQSMFLLDHLYKYATCSLASIFPSAYAWFLQYFMLPFAECSRIKHGSSSSSFTSTSTTITIISINNMNSITTSRRRRGRG